MQRVAFSLLVLVVATSVARADLCLQICSPPRHPLRPPSATSPSLLLRTAVDSLEVSSGTMAGLRRWEFAEHAAMVRGMGAATPGSLDNSIAPGNRAVSQLPPPPSGDVLCLSGLVTIAAFQLARSARHVHLSALPAWYHTHCPEQIGHAVPFEFDWGLRIPRPAEQPLAERAAMHHPRPDVSVCRFTSQCVLPLTAPRAPPVVSRSLL